MGETTESQNNPYSKYEKLEKKDFQIGSLIIQSNEAADMFLHLVKTSDGRYISPTPELIEEKRDKSVYRVVRLNEASLDITVKEASGKMRDTESKFYRLANEQDIKRSELMHLFD